jgi:hypothetical protein
MYCAGHSLFVGKTMHGKTQLAKRMAKYFSDAGTPVLVLTPFVQDNWDADYITDDKEDFLNMVFSHTDCLVVVDEGGEFADKHDKTMYTLATRGRHNGHLCFFIAQRANMVHVNIRTQCSNLFIFRSSINDCRMLANDFAVLNLDDAAKLPAGKCLAVMDGREPFKIEVF